MGRDCWAWMVVTLACACGAPEPPPAPPSAPPAEPSVPRLNGPWTATPFPERPEPVDPTTVPPVLTASPPPGLYAVDVDITLSCSDPTVPIWYTSDGTPPVIGASPVWSGPLTVREGTPVRAVCENAHGDDEFTGAWLRMNDALAGFSSNLPVLVLWTQDRAPEQKTEAYTPFQLASFEPAPGGRTALTAPATWSGPAGLKVRGSSSAGYPKRPYRLETWDALEDDDEDVPLLGLPADGDWVLLAPLDFDRSLLRDALMYRLSHQIGRYAPRTAFAEVFVAERGEVVGRDDYVGVYVLIERIERGGDRVDITRLDPTDTQPPEVTGGYLFKEDRTGPGEFGFYAAQGLGLSFQQPFVWVDPEEAEVVPEQAAYLSGALDELGVALTSPDFTHPVTGRHYRDLIDVDAWIDHHILNVLAKNPDAFRLSGYLHKDREGPIVAGPVWDFDRTLGCTSDLRCDDPNFWDATNVTTDTTAVFRHGFWGGLFADPAFRTAYFDRWRTLLQTTWTVPALFAEVDALAAQLDEAAPRNYAVWPEYPPRPGGHAAEVEALKDWLAARHAWIEGCLDRPNPLTCR